MDRKLSRDNVQKFSQTCRQLGPSPPSPKGTAVAAEAAPALLSPSSAPQSTTEQNIYWAILSEVLQDVQELKQQVIALRQVLTVNESVDTAKNEESSVLSPHSTPSPLPAQLSSQAPREQQEEGAASASVRAVQESEDGTLTGEDKDWKEDIDSELSQWENEEQAEVSHREMNNSQEVSQGQECPEQEPSHFSDEKSFMDVTRCSDLSDGRECIEQGLLGGEESSCADKEEWDEVSLLELPPEDSKDEKREVLVAEGLPVPVPREAGAECPEQEPCSQGPAPAPHSPPSPWPARLGAQALRGQPAAPGKRPSRFRRALRALRGLFCCSCLRPRTAE